MTHQVPWKSFQERLKLFFLKSSTSYTLAFYFDKKFNNERHCTCQYVWNLFLNIHGWFSADCICFLGQESASSRYIDVLPDFNVYISEGERASLQSMYLGGPVRQRDTRARGEAVVGGEVVGGGGGEALGIPEVGN